MQCQTCDYLLSCRVSLPCTWYQIILLGDRGTHVSKQRARSCYMNMEWLEAKPWPLDHKSKGLTITTALHTPLEYYSIFIIYTIYTILYNWRNAHLSFLGHWAHTYVYHLVCSAWPIWCHCMVRNIIIIIFFNSIIIIIIYYYHFYPWFYRYSIYYCGY